MAVNPTGLRIDTSPSALRSYTNLPDSPTISSDIISQNVPGIDVNEAISTTKNVGSALPSSKKPPVNNSNNGTQSGDFMLDPIIVEQNPENQESSSGSVGSVAYFNSTVSVLSNIDDFVSGAIEKITSPINAAGGLVDSVSNLLDFDFLDNPLEFGSSSLVKDNTISLAPTSTKNEKIPNPLRNYNHYNYIVTLGSLSVSEVSDPSSLRSAGSFQNVIVRSAGGMLDRRVQTADEGNEHAEYFIDDIEVDAVIAPNQNTRVATGTTVKFSVNEPYSMGKFIETLMLSANLSGFAKYTTAPYCLQIEFAGWDEYGERDVNYYGDAFYMPIMITRVDFDVTDQGSVYNVEAVVYNEVAMQDHINQLKTPTSIFGKTVHEVLQSGKTSLSNVLNGRIEFLEGSGSDDQFIRGYDRYVIAFPKNKNDLSKQISSAKSVSVSSATTVVNNIVEETYQNSDSEDTNTITVVNTSPPQSYISLKNWAEDEANMNEIGKSLLIEDASNGSDQQTDEARTIVDDGLRGPVRTKSTIKERGEKFSYHQGDRITNVIESVLISSVYGRENPSAESQEGFKKWFRIETQVFFDPSTDNSVIQQIGRPRRIYVYSVHPYVTHEARHLSSGQRPANIQGVKNAAKKEYNYFYTGQNEDVLDFNINFNNAYFNSVLADFAQSSPGPEDKLLNTNDIVPTGIGETKISVRDSDNFEAVPTTEQHISSLYAVSGGRRSTYDAIREKIAQQFHDRLINSPVDMITAEMDIWGDPYFIPSELGNYSPALDNSSLNQDGTMSYINNEVFVVVNFRTPIDYLTYGGTMDFPDESRTFSGLYQVWAVTNSFSGGEFRQTLKLIRIPGQNDPETVGNTNSIETGTGKISDKAKLPKQGDTGNIEVTYLDSQGNDTGIPFDTGDIAIDAAQDALDSLDEDLSGDNTQSSSQPPVVQGESPEQPAAPLTGEESESLPNLPSSGASTSSPRSAPSLRSPQTPGGVPLVDPRSPSGAPFVGAPTLQSDIPPNETSPQIPGGQDRPAPPGIDTTPPRPPTQGNLPNVDQSVEPLQRGPSRRPNVGPSPRQSPDPAFLGF